MKTKLAILALFTGVAFTFADDGQVIGAIGVSGARSAAQDEEVAKAGAGAVADAMAVAI